MIKRKCLVIGFGSIGQRHVKILNELGHHVAVVSSQLSVCPYQYTNVEEALHNENPDYIIIANVTSEHDKTIKKLVGLGYKNEILVEKPLYSRLNESNFDSESIFVGYNLRFHPIIQKLLSDLAGKQIISVHSYVGQYLPTWRPGSDYRESYSSNKSRGGGVLRDLSHELDYLQLLFGQWKAMSAYGGGFSDLEIDSDDHFTLMYSTKNVPVINLHMNYLDHLTQRFMIINTNTTTYRADFKSNTLQINEELIQYVVDRDDTYKNQHVALLNGEIEYLCTYKEGYNTLKMIDGAERSSREKVWVYNE